MTQRRSEHWEDRTGFDHNSRNLTCSITGIPYKGRVFRGPNIDHEGYFDISEYAAEDLAKHIGWVSPKAHNTAQAKYRSAKAERDAYEAEVASLRDQVKVLTLANAELYTLFDEGDEPEDDDE